MKDYLDCHDELSKLLSISLGTVDVTRCFAGSAFEDDKFNPMHDSLWGVEENLFQAQGLLDEMFKAHQEVISNKSKE